PPAREPRRGGRMGIVAAAVLASAVAGLLFGSLRHRVPANEGPSALAVKAPSRAPESPSGAAPAAAEKTPAATEPPAPSSETEPGAASASGAPSASGESPAPSALAPVGPSACAAATLPEKTL